MFKRSLFFLAITAMAISAQAQEKWSLLKCVQYAKDNNISVKQADLQTVFLT
jgi:outer membrane protein